MKNHPADNCNEKVYIKCDEIKVIEKISETERKMIYMRYKFYIY